MQVRNKSLPLNVLLDTLRKRSGNSDVGVGNIRATLVGLFGDDAGSTVKRFVRSLLSRKEAESGEGGILGLVSSLASSFNESRITGGSSPDYPQEDQQQQYGSYEQDHDSGESIYARIPLSPQVFVASVCYTCSIIPYTR
jgi:hypothetical protein